MTPLEARLRARIAAEGPLPIADYMAACLTDPEHGYYTTRNPLGASGDFVTAPEISQMFGEMLGLWLAHMWAEAGTPSAFTLLELGPGRGTLMADVLRAATAVPGFREAADVVFLEVNPTLQQAQSNAVPEARHIQNVKETPREKPLFVLANEFCDALPIRQYQRIADGWAQRQVALAADGLRVTTGPPHPMGGLDQRFPLASDGTIVEINEGAEKIAGLLGKWNATALIIDYGAWEGTGDTLQAVKAHQPCRPLETPGEADLTTHVAFAPLATAAKPLNAHFATQGAFLERLGITARAQALAAKGDHQTIATQHRRLTHPDEMGTLFKVLALTPEPETPPGFEP